MHNVLGRFGWEPTGEELLMVEPQPIDGLLLTASSATEGLVHSSAVSTSGLDAAGHELPRVGAVRAPRRHLVHGPRCGGDPSLRAHPPHRLRERDRPKADRRVDALRDPALALRPANQARVRPLAQGFDLDRPADSGSGIMHYAAKEYRYRLTMIPCPRRGRDVESC